MNDELKDLIGRAMHTAYEKTASDISWSTYKVDYDDLPAKNRFCMDASVEAAAEVIAVWLEREILNPSAERSKDELYPKQSRIRKMDIVDIAKQLRP